MSSCHHSDLPPVLSVRPWLRPLPLSKTGFPRSGHAQVRRRTFPAPEIAATLSLPITWDSPEPAARKAAWLAVLRLAPIGSLWFERLEENYSNRSGAA